MAGVFLLFGLGRWFNSAVIEKSPLIFSVQWSVFYGLIIGVIFFFMIDMMLARGHLQTKIMAVKALLIYLVIVVPFNGWVGAERLLKSPIPFILESSLLLVLILISMFVDSGQKKTFAFNGKTDLPVKYLRRHFLKTLLESVFRLFPYPEPVGLYRLGNPGPESPVFVTGNYDLTIRRVAGELKNIDCWLLVCDSRGINIWCSTLANHFNTGKIIQAIELTGLPETTANRHLILPQLCAANVSLKEIRERTGFICQFGPVRIRDIPIYLNDRQNNAVRKATFTARERLEMAGGTIIFPVIFLVFVFNFIDLKLLFIILPAVYALSFLNALLYPFRFIKDIRLWSLFLGLAVFGIIHVLFNIVLNIDALVANIAISTTLLYLVNEFEGWSPLVKFSVSGSYKRAKIEINEQACTGCGRCMEVCPKGVYKIIGKKSKVINLAECISCKSCFTQCPEQAIEHSARTLNEAFGGI